MPEEKQEGVNPESPLEGAIASSPEAEAATQETQTPPAEEGVTQEESKQPEKKLGFGDPEHPDHERFVELKNQADWYKQQLEQTLQRQQQTPPPPTQPQQDPYQGMTSDEKVFWQNVDARAEQKAKQIMQTQINPQIEAAKQEFARLQVTQFYKDHPDIKPGSPEEMQIADKIRQGYETDDAYKAVMWDKKVGDKTTANQQNQQQRLEAKRKANVVSSQSVSAQSIPPKKETFMEEFERRMKTENVTFD